MITSGGSATQTTTEPRAASAQESPQAENGTASDSGQVFLPSPNPRLDPDANESYINYVSSIVNDRAAPLNTPQNPDLIFDGEGYLNRQYENYDDLLDHYALYLKGILQCNDGQRELFFRALTQAMSNYKNHCNYVAAQDAIFAWAQNGYRDTEEPHIYFDDNDKRRDRKSGPEAAMLQRNEEIRRKREASGAAEDVEMKDSPREWPSANAIGEIKALWEKGTSLLGKLMEDPVVFQGSESAVEKDLLALNHDISKIQRGEKKLDYNLAIPYQEMVIMLVQGTRINEKAKNNPNDQIAQQEQKDFHNKGEAFRVRVEGNNQPNEWVTMLDESIKKNTESTGQEPIDRLIDKMLNAAPSTEQASPPQAQGSPTNQQVDGKSLFSKSESFEDAFVFNSQFNETDFDLHSATNRSIGKGVPEMCYRHGSFMRVLTRLNPGFTPALFIMEDSKRDDFPTTPVKPENSRDRRESCTISEMHITGFAFSKGSTPQILVLYKLAADSRDDLSRMRYRSYFAGKNTRDYLAKLADYTRIAFGIKPVYDWTREPNLSSGKAPTQYVSSSSFATSKTEAETKTREQENEMERLTKEYKQKMEALVNSLGSTGA